MRITRVAAMAAVAALSFTVAACGGDGNGTGSGGSASGIIGKAESSKKLVIGVKSDQPGLGLQTGSAYEGFDIEIGKIIAKGLGVEESGIEWKTTTTPNRESFIQQGTVDLVVATYSITDERKQKVNFAGPYYITGQDLLVKADNTAITGPEALEGKTVCSASGSTPAKRIQTDYPKAKLQQFDAYTKCLPLLENGQVDAVTTDDIILAGYASQDQYAGKFKVVGKPFSSEPYGIGLKKEDVEGCKKVNEILTAAAADGSYKAAWDKTLGKSGTPAPTLDTSKLTNCPA
ncbi:glutamate ABC transporter substrate-binding protein [Plantactinospora sp. B24E8]|uniref:glutamate ABC transporter substrate-binding protein n=1 Tax=Plantactinospora sp. B24E8 TaxID=3153567 RepID=UPI00325E1663